MRGEPGSGPLHDGHSSPTCTATAADLGTPGAGWPHMGGQERAWSRKARYPPAARYPNHFSTVREGIHRPGPGGSQRVQPIYHDTQGRGGAASSSFLFSLATVAG